jgi:hypothetical protein
LDGLICVVLGILRGLVRVRGVTQPWVVCLFLCRKFSLLSVVLGRKQRMEVVGLGLAVRKSLSPTGPRAQYPGLTALPTPQAAELRGFWKVHLVLLSLPEFSHCL